MVAKSLKKWATEVCNKLSEIMDLFDYDLIYDGSFTTGTAALQKTVANYKKIIIVCADNDGSLFTRQIINNNGAFTTYCDVARITGALYTKSMLVSFNGTTMSSSYNRQAAGAATPVQGTYITIKKVYGCRTVVGGVLRKLYLSTTLLWKGGGVDEHKRATDENNTKAFKHWYGVCGLMDVFKFIIDNNTLHRLRDLACRDVRNDNTNSDRINGCADELGGRSWRWPAIFLAWVAAMCSAHRSFSNRAVRMGAVECKYSRDLFILRARIIESGAHRITISERRWAA